MQDGSTPLHMAANNGHTAILEALVTAGAEVNVTDKVHIPPALLFLSPCLPRVCGRGMVAEEAVRWYAIHLAPTDGVKVWGVQHGWTPLIHAAANGLFAIVDALVAAGVDVNVQQKVGTFSPTSSAPPPTASPAGVSSDEASHDGGGSHVAALTAL